MTMIRHMGKLVEWVFVLDNFNNEIIVSALASRLGDPRHCLECLIQLHQKRKESTACPTMLHNNQGSVYSGRAFQIVLNDYNNVLSILQVGTTTAKPIKIIIHQL